LVFGSRRRGHLDLYEKASTGTGVEEVLLQDNFDKYPVSWSPDSRFILYLTFIPGTGGSATGYHLWALPLFGNRKPFPFPNTQFNEVPGEFSPDGRWVTYSSDESGKNEVYVVPFPGPGGKWQVSTAGGQQARWRRDGTEIFYVGPDNKLMAATVDGKGSRFEVGNVKPLFATRAGGPRSWYAVSPDGQRFLINTAPEQTAAPLTVVLNWTAGLEK
jgi:hypothetical protein